MRLADLRRLAIRRQVRIRFPMRSGMECVITEQGVAQAPGLDRTPDFNFEQELAAAGEFLLEPVSSKGRPPSGAIRRAELEEMLTPGTPAAAGEE